MSSSDWDALPALSWRSSIGDMQGNCYSIIMRHGGTSPELFGRRIRIDDAVVGDSACVPAPPGFFAGHSAWHQWMRRASLGPRNRLAQGHREIPCRVGLKIRYGRPVLA